LWLGLGMNASAAVAKWSHAPHRQAKQRSVAHRLVIPAARTKASSAAAAEASVRLTTPSSIQRYDHRQRRAT
jgi:hypothetical protein